MLPGRALILRNRRLYELRIGFFPEKRWLKPLSMITE